VFIVTLSRSQAIAKDLIGESFSGFLGSDRYSSYNWVKTQWRQLCWSHLLRDFQAMAERTGVSQDIGEALLDRGYRLFHWWHRVRDGTMSQELFREAVILLREGFHQELLSAAAIEIGVREKTPLAKTVRTCQQLLKVETALWTFVTTEGIEPTNNAAERALRPAVLWRKNSVGSQSEAGSLFVSRMLTVVTTLRSQNRSVLDYLVKACRAARQNQPAPSLLPADSGTP